MSEPVARPVRGTILGRVELTGPGEEAAGAGAGAGAGASASASAGAASDVEASFAELAADPIEPAPPVDVVADEGRPPVGPARPVPASGGPGRRWLPVGCLVLALAALATAILALQQRSALRSDRSQQRELRDVSGRSVAALTNYDFQHLDAWKKAVLDNATGTFQGEFESSYAGFAAGYVAEQNRATGTVQGVWLGSVDTGKATSVVLVQITVSSLTGTHTVGPLFTQLTLLKVAGRWRVDQIAYFGSNGSVGSSSSGGANSTATTVPGPAATPTSVP